MDSPHPRVTTVASHSNVSVCGDTFDDVTRMSGGTRPWFQSHHIGTGAHDDRAKGASFGGVQLRVNPQYKLVHCAGFPIDVKAIDCTGIAHSDGILSTPPLWLEHHHSAMLHGPPMV